MIDYSKIQDPHLLQLIRESESINSRPEEELQTIINAIGELDTVKQKDVIQLLEQEQKRIREGKLAKGITPEMEIEEIEKNTAKLTAIKHEYDTAVRKYREEKSATEEQQTAEKILDQITK